MGISAPRLLGVLGDPIEHSLSPLMQAAGLHALGIHAHYLPFCVNQRQLAAFLKVLHAAKAWGFNLTAPLKERALRLVEADPLARRLGAVNTLIWRSSAWWGINTDLPALIEALQAAWTDEVPECALIYGAGGVAATSAAALLGLGVEEVWIHARRPGQARALARRIGGGTFGRGRLRSASWSDRPAAARWVVNATPLGQRGQRSALSKRARGQADLVVDWTYRAGGTALSRVAEAEGRQVIGGAQLLLGQGVASLEAWTGAALTPNARRAMSMALRKAGAS